MLSIILIIYAVFGVAFILALAVAAHRPLPKQRVKETIVRQDRMPSALPFPFSQSQQNPHSRRADKWALN